MNHSSNLTTLVEVPPLQVPITKVTGPPFLCLIFNWGLFGVLTTQLCIYYQAFQNDRLLLKILIYFVFLLEVAQTILVTQTAWGLYVSRLADIEAFSKIGDDWVSVSLLGGLVAFLVQSFYAYRILILSKGRLMAGIIMLAALISLTGSLVTSVFMAETGFYNKSIEGNKRIGIAFGIWQGTATACDVLIALCMTYHIKKLLRGVSSVSKTREVANKILRLIVETGTITATMSIISLVTWYILDPAQNYYFEIPISLIAKLYSNTMLVAINSRMKFKVMLESTTCEDVAMVSISPQDIPDAVQTASTFRSDIFPPENIDEMVFASRASDIDVSSPNNQKHKD